MTRTLDLETLLRIPYVEPDGGFDLSPDGRQIAFSWNPAGRWDIYVVSPDLRSAPPRPITAGPGAKFAPRWSPDGRRLAYAVDLDGGELIDIFSHDLETGEHTNLTPNTPDAIQPNYCWSPDGRWIAFISDRSGRFDTYVMPASGGDARPVLDLPYPDWTVSWSPDGRWLAVVTKGNGQDYYTYLVPWQGDAAAPEPISDDRGPICAKDAAWSPDSSCLAFSSDKDGSFDVGIYERETGRIAWATKGDGDQESPAWSPDGQSLAFVHHRGPVASLQVLGVEGRAQDDYSVGPGMYYTPRFTPDGRRLVFVFDSPRHPDDLWLLDLADDSFRQLTRSLPVEFGEAQFVMPTQVEYPSLDGQSVPALLYRPRGSKLPPAVVSIHGGPNWLTQVTWDPLVQHMVSRGWAVLAPNYRGSTGYGREWQTASRFDFGGVDTEDVVAGADYLAREGLADPSRIVVTGRSWGGYLTMSSLTRYPDRWAAGSAVVPFLNWFTGHANSRADLQHWDLENFGHPEKDHDLYHERSPFFFLDRVNAPVQLICGAHDVRCPASESVQARDVLAAAGKRCDLVLYPDEGHAFLKTETQIDAKKRRVAFLAESLEDKPDQV